MAPSSALQNSVASKPNFFNKVVLFIAAILSCATVFNAIAPRLVSAQSAGLAWSFKVGNMGVKVLKPHYGYGGPKVGNLVHTNIVFYKIVKGSEKDIINLHHSKYKSRCYYGWDSIKKKVYYDICVNWSWLLWVAAAAAAMTIAYMALSAGLAAVSAVPVVLLAT